MRLDKYLAETAQCTRSEAKALLSKGRVQVNGAVCKKGDTQLKESDTVAVDGKALNYQQFVYLMLNKPEGVVSASTDKRDTTVVDLVGDAYPRRQLFPAGRLDKTSTGFVLLTDDGTFAHEILAPKRHVSKTYTVVLDTPLTEEMRTGFAAGVTLADGTALSPAEFTSQYQGAAPFTLAGKSYTVTDPATGAAYASAGAVAEDTTAAEEFDPTQWNVSDTSPEAEATRRMYAAGLTLSALNGQPLSDELAPPLDSSAEAVARRRRRSLREAKGNESDFS